MPMKSFGSWNGAKWRSNYYHFRGKKFSIPRPRPKMWCTHNVFIPLPQSSSSSHPVPLTVTPTWALSGLPGAAKGPFLQMDTQRKQEVKGQHRCSDPVPSVAGPLLLQSAHASVLAAAGNAEFCPIDGHLTQPFTPSWQRLSKLQKAPSATSQGASLKKEQLVNIWMLSSWDREWTGSLLSPRQHGTQGLASAIRQEKRK